MAGTEGRPTVTLISAIAKAEHLVVVVLGAAPDAATIFPKYPHKEGRVAVILEVEGTPPAQSTRVGERLPTASQECVAYGGDLDCNPRSLVAVVVRLQPETT